MVNATKAESRRIRKRDAQRRWHAAHPTYNRDYMRKRYAAKGSRYEGYARKANLKKKYGLTLEEYATKLANQNGVCAICGDPPKRYRLAVDHDHETGKIRDLLCLGCNAKLETIENPVFVAKAKAYLQAHEVYCG